ncbi:MAG: hypothetical protein HY706_00575 [Candidatus Hydrogenedentes bacterium]|nr:hypothetical protein [Candidatus Hydrogenedentota bacterium]
MELVNITDAKPGQVVAKAITNAEGAILCPAGYRLTEGAIARLKAARIESIVLGVGDDRGLSLEQRVHELRERFQDVDDPIMIQIRATIERRLTFMMLRGEEVS